MIDFKNGTFVKLQIVDNDVFKKTIQPLLVEGENIVSTYKGMRDGVIFTNKRIIAVNTQGITGNKKDFTSLPYSKIQLFSVETAGMLETFPDTELELYFSGVGKIKFEFHKNANIIEICKLISSYAL